MPTVVSYKMRARHAAVLSALVALAALAACLGDIASPRATKGDAVVDLRGLRVRHQTSGGDDEVGSARFTVFLLTGNSRRAVATRTFTANDLDAAETNEGTIFTISFPYTSADDRFEVEGWGLSPKGDTLYKVGPTAFTMRAASSQGGQAAVSVTAAPVYVGPGATATKLTIAPRSVSLTEGKTASLSATLTDAKGATIAGITPHLYWYTSDPAVARFNDQWVGVVTGGSRAGSVWLYARWDPLNLVDSIPATNAAPPTQLKLVGGSDQSGPAGAELGKSLEVQVLSASGQPVSGVTVTFAVSSGGGRVSASTVVSAANGMASVRWTLGPTIGAQVVTASVPGLSPVIFSAVARQSTPTASRSTVSVLPTAIQVGGDEATVTAILRDANGAPIPNVVATFSGSSALTFSSASGTTDGAGTVSTRVRSAEAGSMVIYVLVGSEVMGSATLQVGARVGVPAGISIVSGDNQSVKVGQNFPEPLVVVVRDATGKPVAGALVDWATQVGDGRKVTDANGQSAAQYYLTPTWPLGQGTITVSVTGYSFSVTFKYTAVP